MSGPRATLNPASARSLAPTTLAISVLSAVQRPNSSSWPKAKPGHPSCKIGTFQVPDSGISGFRVPGVPPPCRRPGPAGHRVSASPQAVPCHRNDGRSGGYRQRFRPDWTLPSPPADTRVPAGGPGTAMCHRSWYPPVYAGRSSSWSVQGGLHSQSACRFPYGSTYLHAYLGIQVPLTTVSQFDKRFGLARHAICPSRTEVFGISWSGQGFRVGSVPCTTVQGCAASTASQTTSDAATPSMRVDHSSWATSPVEMVQKISPSVLV